jgi:hypothetical protein
MPPNALTIEEKRQWLIQHVAQKASGHDYFRTHDGYHFEGYILEVGETAVLFEWALGPFAASDEYSEPLEIPIESIDISSLR